MSYLSQPLPSTEAVGGLPAGVGAVGGGPALPGLDPEQLAVRRAGADLRRKGSRGGLEGPDFHTASTWSGGGPLLAAVADGVVGDAGVPAGPDDTQPGAHEDADGMRVPLAAGLSVDLSRPGRAVTGVVGEGREGFAGAGVGGPAAADGLGRAGGLGDRRGAALGGGLLDVEGAVGAGDGLGQDLGEVDAAAEPWQSGEERRLGGARGAGRRWRGRGWRWRRAGCAGAGPGPGPARAGSRGRGGWGRRARSAGVPGARPACGGRRRSGRTWKRAIRCSPRRAALSGVG